jgi:hypothetical protein
MGSFGLAVACFGPAFVLFVWAIVHFYTGSAVLVPITIMIGFLVILGVAKSLPDPVAKVVEPVEPTPEVSDSSLEVDSTPRGTTSARTRAKHRFNSAIDPGLSLFSLLLIVALAYTHLQKHDPQHAHGLLPLGVQAILVSMVVGALGLLSYRLIRRKNS